MNILTDSEKYEIAMSLLTRQQLEYYNKICKRAEQKIDENKSLWVVDYKDRSTRTVFATDIIEAAKRAMEKDKQEERTVEITNIKFYA